MSDTLKKNSKRDYEQVLRTSYNDVNGTIGVDGFLTGLVGRKVELTLVTTSVADDTEVFNFSENGIDLYEFTVIYTDGTRSQLLSAERTA